MFQTRIGFAMAVFLVLSFVPAGSSAQFMSDEVAAGQASAQRSQMRREAHNACIQGNMKACDDLIGMLNAPIPRGANPTIGESYEAGEISGIRMDISGRFSSACQNGSQYACDALRRLQFGR